MMECRPSATGLDFLRIERQAAVGWQWRFKVATTASEA